MPIRKIVFLALVLICCVAPSIAQSANGKAKEVAQAVVTDPQAPRDSRTQTPSLSGIGKSAVHSAQLDFAGGSKRVRIATLPPKGDSVCYAIRSYNFEPVDPSTGMMNLKGMSTCELATNAHLKSTSGVLSK